MIDTILSQTGFFSIISLFAMGAFGALLFYEHDHCANLWGSICALAGSVGGLLFAILVIMQGAFVQYTIPTSLPLLTIAIKIDFLSAFFLGVISLISFICTLYAIGYARHFYGKYNIGTLLFFYNLFIASMILVVTSNHAIPFLISWELMALASYMLVIYERKTQENITAGSLYFIMTHVGTACIILAFLLMYHWVGSFDFDIIRKSSDLIPLFAKDVIFVSALIGFGIKCGIIPLHIWLPAAHPAAPSHVSALMSGVMIKTGIYMLIRICIDFFPNIPEWWGLAILVIGAVSSLLGVLYALSEHDIKKLLAYHSIENIGIILLGLGSSLVFLSAHLYGLAAVGLVAALYHTVNHALFKTLLFLGAGSVILATHTRNIEEYGGLIKRMPQTAFFFLIGSMAISALPPFNGFASEWLTFQSLFGGVMSLDLIPKLIFTIALSSLAFTGGLAAACFVKAFGITFLARPRSEHSTRARESAPSMRVGMALCAALTLLFGVGAGLISTILGTIIRQFPQFFQEHPFVDSRSLLVANEGFASLSLPSIALGLLVLFVGVALTMRILFANRKVTYGRTWDCGSDLTPRMEITATGFSRSLITVFKSVLFPVRKTTVDYSDPVVPYFPHTNTITLELRDMYRSIFYDKFTQIMTAISNRARTIQSGNVNMYILYILIALITLLTTLALS